MAMKNTCLHQRYTRTSESSQSTRRKITHLNDIRLCVIASKPKAGRLPCNSAYFVAFVAKRDGAAQ